MNILDEIIAYKHREVALQKERVSIRSLESGVFFSRSTLSLAQSLRAPGGSGIIAEIKRKSPSQGIIHPDVYVERIAAGYTNAGAAGLSILTDSKYFGGSNEDLSNAKNLVSVPILRKEFVVDEYQIMEAKSIGADVILLIAAALSPAQISQFTKSAHALGMEVLLEVHNERELEQNCESEADFIGVNNRNLKTFEVSVKISRRLIEKIPSRFVKISESGIDSVKTVRELKDLGFDGFLMGQNFMKHRNPEGACKAFIMELTTGQLKTEDPS